MTTLFAGLFLLFVADFAFSASHISGVLKAGTSGTQVCADKSPYCNRNDCVLRPGYSIEYCQKTCGDCNGFCQESLYVSCNETSKKDCEFMLRDYCPILCGLCRAQKNRPPIREPLSAKTERTPVGPTMSPTIYDKTTPEPSPTFSDEGMEQKNTLTENVNDNPSDEHQLSFLMNKRPLQLEKMNPAISRDTHAYFGSPSDLEAKFTALQASGVNLKPKHRAVSVINHGPKTYSRGYISIKDLIPEINSANNQLEYTQPSSKHTSTSNTAPRRKSLQMLPLENLQATNHITQTEKPQRRSENEQLKQYYKKSLLPLTDPNTNSAPLYFKPSQQKNRNLEMEKTYTQAPIIPVTLPKPIPISRKNNYAQQSPMELPEYLTGIPATYEDIRSMIQSTLEQPLIPETEPPKIDNSAAITDIIALLSCRDKDSTICSMVTEEACNARPGYYLKLCPVKCKNCNSLLCLDSNKIDCRDVKARGGCLLPLSEEYCPKTCLKCTTPLFIETKQSPCKDELDSCEYLVESGVCNHPFSQDTLRQYCAKSCGFCKSSPFYITQTLPTMSNLRNSRRLPSL